MKIQEMKTAKKLGNKKRIWGNSEYKNMTESSADSKEWYKEAWEDESKEVYDRYRFVSREIYEERLKDSSREIYEAQEDAFGERYKRYGNASEDIHEEDHGDTYEEAVKSH